MGIIGKTLRFTIGLLLGAGVGAAAVLLVAPQSGKVTKEQIQARLDEVMGAGRSAQHAREKELQEYWEQEIDTKGQSTKGKEDKAKGK